MGLKIKIAIPFLPNYVKEVEFDDFERIDIGIKGEKNSNHFLWQLWHLFDVKYTPETADGFVPWAFMPSRYCGKKNNVVVLGNETASFADSSHEVCKTCGNVKYKIGARVKDFVAKYINEDLGKLFKSLYSIRSHYLHTGILSTSGDFLNARPLLDMGTDSGIIDSSFISVKINGDIKNVFANNIREWTTYCLRCYYHEKLFNNTNFEVEDIYNNNSSSYIKHISELKLVSKIEGIEITGVGPT